MRLRLRHETRYAYERPTLFGPHLVRLRPTAHARARVLSYNLGVEPEVAAPPSRAERDGARAFDPSAPFELRWQTDPWGNHVARVSFPTGATYRSLAFVVDLALEISPVNPFDFQVDDRCRDLPFAYPDGLEGELAPFLTAPTAGPRLRRFIGALPARGFVTDYLVALNRLVAREVRYVIRNDPGVQTTEETLALGSGSCRDSALLLCQVLRAQGLAARFVSGYLVQLADEGIIPDQAKGVSRDVADLHAWCEVFLPGAGWIGLDGTSGLFTGEGHEPRPRRPYTDEQWSALLAAGDRVDQVLGTTGETLTTGGEPTWTSREHPDAPEWNTTALGPTKWTQGLRLARELFAHLGNGPLLLVRQGKHYPGESLPRWALHLLWRRDAVPVWRDSALLDLEARSAPGGQAPVQPSEPKRPTSHPPLPSQLERARAFGERLCRRLGVAPGLQPGFEDPWRAIVDEQNLPFDVDPLRANLDDPEERRRLARALGRGLGTAVGYALPLARTSSGWVSDAWSFRRGHLFLIPGDSPMGLRLPLERLGGAPALFWEEDSTAVETALRFQHPPRGAGAEARSGPSSGEPEATPPAGEPGAGERIRTALCLEPRDGSLCVFLPPVPSAEDFLALVSGIEDTAAELGQPVRLEGYPPPADPRLEACLVTPDPGVLEVNLPPAVTFREHVELLALVHDAANHAGLSTEKYQLDGREVGSGGGHHLTLGGPTPVQSPFLRRPELLAGVIRTTQRHPSLSFLFASQFVGPTSQAPRVDEARNDALVELELALARAERAGELVPPWLADRLFRNLLADVSGNTHRTELCIDKLFDPSSLSGRQGLVELRAFEMPPHERMAAAQVLLVRGLVARLLQEPCHEPLVRWGTELHDRFMLPHYLWADLRTILTDLRAHGLPFDEAWFQPFLDYRLPVAGRLTLEDLELEVRAAIEPWHVLAEQPGSHGGTSRYVDSSLERLQVRVDGLVEGRHEVLVNGLRLPLRPTGRAAERVGGVRFRAWQPPFCLQPEIGIHHPLRFDVVDTWARRSLGAATYHVWHPEGRAFDAPPLTLFEASARRAQRFTREGHAPWPVRSVATEPHPEHPFTLDLRLFPGDRRSR